MAKPKTTSTITDVLKIFWTSLKKYKWTFVFVVIVNILTSILSVIIPTYYKSFFDILASAGVDRSASGSLLLHILFIVLGINSIIWLTYRLGIFAINHLEVYVIADLRQRAFEHLLEHSDSFFNNNFTGSLVQRINRLGRSFERLMDRLVFNIVPMVVYISGTCIIVWQIKPSISLAIMVWLVVFMSFNYFFSRYKLKYDIAVAEYDSKTTGFLSDNITNHNTIRLFTSTKFEADSFKKISNEQAKIWRFAWNLSGVVDAVQASLVFIVEFLLFYFAVVYWKAGIVSIGTFVLIQVYFMNLSGRLWEFSRLIRDLYEGFADAKEMADIMLLPHEIKDVPNAKVLEVSSGRIEFKDVTFSFNSDHSVLSKISTEIVGGQKIALIGPSGAGKSTFIRLILRLYDLISGEILIDGQNIHNVTQESLRERVSLVPQDPILFHRTLMENIRYGRKNATDEEVFEAARLAHCDEFVQNLPLKYETYVGERGIKLSGGERQRIAIARAILKNAPILILDEATSSLDSASESLIQDALDVLMKGKTTIVIAHRLSTIRKMDRIIVMDAGSIIEDDTHDELLKNESSLYGKLWKLQAGGFIA